MEKEDKKTRAFKVPKSNDIKDAQVIEEIANTGTFIENQTDLPFEKEVKKEEKANVKTISIEINDKEKEQKSTTTIDFMEDSDMQDFIGKQTQMKSGQVIDTEAIFEEGTTIEDIKRQIAEKENGGNMKPNDLADISGLIIEGLDSIISTICRAIANDDSTAAYGIDARKKQNLTKYASMIAVKYQSKFKVEWLFALSLIAAYTSPAQKAFSRGMAVKQIKRLKRIENRTEREDFQLKELEDSIKRGRGNVTK